MKKDADTGKVSGFLSDLSYEKAKQIAKNGTADEKAQLAAALKATPELLVFLAADTNRVVREAVAGNIATPLPAQRLLAADAEADVRKIVANSLARLWPDYAVDPRTEVRENALQALELLAVDQALKVREALASALKDIAMAPPGIVARLAADIAQAVAEPILRQCARLDEETLVSLALSRREDWAQLAIAGRPSLPRAVTAAIGQSGNREAVRLMLENRGADIADDTLDAIAEGSKTEKSWQIPIVKRPSLPRAISVKLAEFIDVAAFDILKSRSDFDEALTAEIVSVARRRLDWVERYQDGTPAAARALKAWRDGTLNEGAISDAIAWGDKDFVTAGIALLSRIEPGLVRAILQSGSGQGVTALAWKARLSMRAAMQLQKAIANIPPHRLLHARNGTDFPLSETELIWHLEFFGCNVG